LDVVEWLWGRTPTPIVVGYVLSGNRIEEKSRASPSGRKHRQFSRRHADFDDARRWLDHVTVLRVTQRGRAHRNDERLPKEARRDLALD